MCLNGSVFEMMASSLRPMCLDGPMCALSFSDFLQPHANPIVRHRTRCKPNCSTAASCKEPQSLTLGDVACATISSQELLPS